MIAVLHERATPGDTLKPADVLLGVEIAHSSIDSDLGEKMKHYAGAGIQDYLVVDINAERLILMTGAQGGAFTRTVEGSSAQGVVLPDAAGPMTLD